MGISAEPPSRLPAVPFFSFVVPVRNEERRLGACLASLAGQQYPGERFEVLVVEGGSRDGTRRVLAEFAAGRPEVSLRVLENPQHTVAPGRNVGLRAARGEVIVFVEGHAQLDPDFLSQAAAALTATGARCLGRYVEQYLPEGTRFQRATGLARKSWLGHNPHSGRFLSREARWMNPLGVATVYRREVFAQFGEYEESFTTNEDVEFNYRLAQAGVEAWYSPALRYRLQPRESFRGLLRQMYFYGVGKRRFVRRHPEARRLAYLAPTALCVSALAALALRPLPRVASVLALPLLAYVGMALLIAARQVRYGLGTALLIPVVMLGIAAGFGAGYGRELLSDLVARGRSSAGLAPAEERSRPA